MTEIELLNNALYRSATIHQPHALKAFLAAQNLSKLFGQIEGHKMAIWQHTADLIEQSEIQVEGSFVKRVEASSLTEFRIHRVLELGIYPVAYQAVYQWHNTKGMSEIFAHYIHIASGNDEYLSHNMTILLAFNRLYPQLDAVQITPFLERLTEFITASFTSKKATPLIENHPPYDFKDLLNVCLEQPSFFGHNLITLTWIMRCKADLTATHEACLYSNLYQQATRPLEDPDDVLDEALFAVSQSTRHQARFYQSLQHLVFDTCHNLHQVTLADALLYLDEQFPEERARISRVAVLCEGVPSFIIKLTLLVMPPL